MDERLFQYLWQNSLFSSVGLKTTEGEPLTILNPGRLNRDSGPDFSEGKIKIGGAVWIGNIELHLKASDWEKHGHHLDPAYNNIILHVVLEDDVGISVGNFPTLVLESGFDDAAIQRYYQLMNNQEKIACFRQIANFPEIKWQSWLNRLLAERWEEKLKDWEILWKQTDGDWRQLLYLRMAANFGFHTNYEPFLETALSLPLNILSKNRNKVERAEAILFGQAGLLSVVKNPDDYTLALTKEYNFIRRKYELTGIPGFKWRFMRMRPANFPTVRLAQFAMLVHKSLDLFSKMMEMTSVEEMLPLLDITASGYWDSHYRLSAESEHHVPKKLGKTGVHNLIINTIAPMQFLYAKLQGKDDLVETSVSLLSSLPAERNNIIREWEAIGKIPKDAAESQALIQLFNRYCSSKRCLDCAIGSYLVKDSGIDYKRI